MARAGRVSGGICIRGRRARWLSLKRFWWRPARKIYDLFPKRGRIVKTLYYGITVTIRNASATTYSRQHRERFAHQVLPNYDAKLATVCNGEKSSNLTFSKPKNLSLPSVLMGPASARSLSRGVSWGAFGSFLVGVLPAEVSAGFCPRATSATTRSTAAPIEFGRNSYGSASQAAEKRRHGEREGANGGAREPGRRAREGSITATLRGVSSRAELRDDNRQDGRMRGKACGFFSRRWSGRRRIRAPVARLLAANAFGVSSSDGYERHMRRIRPEYGTTL